MNDWLLILAVISYAFAFFAGYGLRAFLSRRRRLYVQKRREEIATMSHMHINVTTKLASERGTEVPQRRSRAMQREMTAL